MSAGEIARCSAAIDQARGFFVTVLFPRMGEARATSGHHYSFVMETRAFS